MSTFLDVLSAVALIITALGGAAGVGVLIHRRRDAKRKDAETEKIERESDKVSADASQVIAVAAAESAQVLTSAATGLVAPLQDQVSKMRGEIDELRQGQIERDQLAAEHAGWDKFVELEAERHGLALPARPPLIPPRPPASATTRH